MKNIKIDINTALKASAALGAIVGLDIYPGWIPRMANLPCCCFYRVFAHRGTADGKMSVHVEELYSIDCFAKTMLETENMEIAIDAAMNTLDWIVTAEHGPDLYEQDTQVYHKVLRYRIKS